MNAFDTTGALFYSGLFLISAKYLRHLIPHGITWFYSSRFKKSIVSLLWYTFSSQTPLPSCTILFFFWMEPVQFYISMTSVLDCLDHSNNTYKFLKWLAFPFDVKWSAVCLPGLSEQDHCSCYTIYVKESLSFNVRNPCAFVGDTAAVKMCTFVIWT